MALGPPPLNRQPVGLLDLLGIKNGGRYPQFLLEQLAPTLDLFQWYVTAEAISYSLVSTAAVGGASASPIAANIAGGNALFFNDTTPTGQLPRNATGQVSCPNDEYWIVSHYSVNWLIPAVAADRCELIPSFQPPTPGGFSQPSVLEGAVAGNATVASYGARTMHDIVIVPPGTTLFARVVHAITANTPFGGKIALMRMRA